MKKVIIDFFTLCFGYLFNLQAQDLYLWHAFDGFLEEKFKAIFEDFNHLSGSYTIREK